MTDVAAVNLRFILRTRIERDPFARRALDVALAPSKLAPSSLDRLLRHHANEDVTDPDELELREGFDRLLAVYSLVEIGSFVGAMPSPLPARLCMEAKDVLTPEAVGRYYVDFYPQPLVYWFLERVNGRRDTSLPGEHRTGATGLYRAFLDLNTRIEDDNNAQTFLRMLDDHEWGPTTLDSLVRLCRRPEDLAKALVAPDEERTLADQAAVGMREFLGFAVDLRDLLAAAAVVSPVLPPYFWHYHAYWFSQLGEKLSHDLDRILNQFDSWVATDQPAPLESEDNQDAGEDGGVPPLDAGHALRTTVPEDRHDDNDSVGDGADIRMAAHEGEPSPAIPLPEADRVEDSDKYLGHSFSRPKSVSDMRGVIHDLIHGPYIKLP